jgi:hypothetical protein
MSFVSDVIKDLNSINGEISKKNGVLKEVLFIVTIIIFSFLESFKNYRFY